MKMKKFPEVKMSEVAAVLSCQNDDERLIMLRKVVIRSLMDYYSMALCTKVFMIAVDPVTSAQMAGQRHALISQRVREKFSLWWNVPLVSSQEMEGMYNHWQSRIEKMDECKILLDVFNWYHFKVRIRIHKTLRTIENETVSLRSFLRVCFYLYSDLQQVKK